MSDVKRFAIIDGKSVFYRGYYALPYLSTKDGTSTGGVFGFATMALEVLRRLKPDYVAVAWDKPKTNIRKRLEIYPEYKAGRKPAPPDFYDQIPLLHELLKAFGWPLYELDDYEADDIMGTLAVQASKKDIETMLITSDLDMLQMIDDKVSVYALKTGLSNIELYSPKSFEAKYHIKVDQFLDFKAIKGDSSDNIPGVPGIGEKGAVDLLSSYETLDGVYDNLELIKDALKKKLEAGKKSAYMSKELARIWTDAPITLDLKQVDGSNIKPDQVIDLLEKFEFKSLVRNLPESMQAAIENHKVETGQVVTKKQKAVFIKSVKDLSEIKLLSSEIYIHSFTADAHGSSPLVLAFSDASTSVYCLDKEVLVKGKAELEKILKHVSLIGYDLKSTLKLLLNLGIELPKIEHDIQVGAFLLDPLGRDKTLSELASKTIGYEGSGFESLDPESMLSSEAEIISIIKAIYSNQAKELKTYSKLSSLAKDIEWPIISVLANMEYKGIELDTAYLDDFADEINDFISDFSQQIYGYADQEFNIDSPSQLADILFNKMGLPTAGIKKGKTEYSTAAKELDKLRGKHPIIDMITQYREVAKLKNTYVDTLPKLVDENSRLHTTFNLTIAQTGRLSSTDPNLQNIPIRTDLGKRIRTAFVAGKGKKLVSADYSQFELRLAAVLANDTELIDMFNRGADIHATTAAQVYGREQEDVTKQMRRAAKVINFGILYGMSPHGLSVAANMTREQATDFIDKYKQLRAPIFGYIETVKDHARKEGYVETMFGRRRPTPDIHSSNFVVRQAAERAAINLPIQGTEADLMKMAMIKTEQVFKKDYKSAEMLLQIHDSILIECPQDQAKEIADVLKNIMESIYKLPVRLDVDVTVGDNWGEL
jgi:DNA polymerase-1